MKDRQQQIVLKAAVPGLSAASAELDMTSVGQVMAALAPSDQSLKAPPANSQSEPSAKHISFSLKIGFCWDKLY